MDFRIGINGRQADVAGLPGVYAELAWDLSAQTGERVESTGGTTDLPAPDPQNFIPASEVTPEIKLSWLVSQFPESWLAEQKAHLAERFAVPARHRAEPVSMAV